MSILLYIVNKLFEDKTFWECFMAKNCFCTYIDIILYMNGVLIIKVNSNPVSWNFLLFNGSCARKFYRYSIICIAMAKYALWLRIHSCYNIILSSRMVMDSWFVMRLLLILVCTLINSFITLMHVSIRVI